MKQYAVTFKTSIRISPNDFTVMNPTLFVDSNTTIYEIEVFYRKYNDFGFTEFTVIELQNGNRNEQRTN